MIFTTRITGNPASRSCMVMANILSRFLASMTWMTRSGESSRRILLATLSSSVIGRREYIPGVSMISKRSPAMTVVPLATSTEVPG